MAFDLEKHALLNQPNYQLDIDKFYLYAKDAYEGKYQLLINKHDSKTFIEYSYRKYLRK